MELDSIQLLERAHPVPHILHTHMQPLGQDSSLLYPYMLSSTQQHAFMQSVHSYVKHLHMVDHARCSPGGHLHTLQDFNVQGKHLRC